MTQPGAGRESIGKRTYLPITSAAYPAIARALTSEGAECLAHWSPPVGPPPTRRTDGQLGAAAPVPNQVTPSAEGFL
jgi:hypothetical protein